MKKIRQKAIQLKMFLGCQGFSLNEKAAYQILRSVEQVNEKGGQATISDAADIEFAASEIYDPAPTPAKDDTTQNTQ